MSMKHWLRGMASAIAMGVAMLFPTMNASAIDRITLKDGTVVEGEITREIDGYYFIKSSIGGIEQTSNYGPSQIQKVERNASAAAKNAGAEAKSPANAEATTPVAVPAAAPSGRKVPRAAVITLGEGGHKDMVGVYMTAETIRRAIPILEKELGTDKTGVVVFRISSGGGLGLEVQRLSDVIENEYKPRFRVVGWIESAISAAAMTAHTISELYFTSQGNYGACTGFYGSIDRPVEGIPLELALHEMEKISRERGKYDPRIMRSMQIQDPLSATIDSNGDVHYFSDLTSGDIVVNREKEILTFNAVTAAKVKFSKGTADTLDELTKLMGYAELEWVGERVKNVPWPVSKAERLQMDFRNQVKTDEDSTNNYFRNYQRALQAAQSGQTREERGKFVGVARGWFEKILKMVKNNPNFKLTVFNMTNDEQWREWVEEQEKIMRELSR